uniref:hypothetical protein n=2 Tax=Pseudomonadati TaxID=3379134 RepID=UPI004048B047
MSNLSGSTLMQYGQPQLYPVPVFGHSQRFPVPNAKRQRANYSYYGTGTITKKKQANNRYRKSFSRKVLNVFPAKHLSGESQVTINNSTVYTMNLTAQVGQGTANNQREGDSIHLEALKINGLVQSATESNAYKFRILIGYSGEEFGTTTFASGSLSSSEIFLPTTFTTTTNGIVNPKAFTVLYDKTIDLNSQVEGDRVIQSFSDTLRLNTKFPYQASASVYGKFKNLYAICISYAPDIAVGVPNGSILFSYDLIFKD